MNHCKQKNKPGFGYVLALAVAFSVATLPAQSQKGDPAVWTSSTVFSASTAYVDASAFCGSSGCSGVDFCSVANQALAILPSAGGVVDARGVNPGGSNSCGSGNTPYLVGSTAIGAPSTLLLPSGTITISKTWTMPNGSKIIGQGAGSSSYYGATTLVGTTALSGDWMIQMGGSSGSFNCSNTALGHCTEIGVEDLNLEGPPGVVVNGIFNGQGQDQSYVTRVNMYQIDGAGLGVTNSAQNSGPYTDIVFDGGSYGTSSTVCAEITNVATRGIHGLTCELEAMTSGASAPFAVEITSSNNSVRDARISGLFGDGVRVTASASNVLLFNIAGGSGAPSSSNLVNLLSSNATANLSVMGATKGSFTNTVDDQTTGTKLTDSYLAMYVLGESGVLSGKTALGYSRFTTSMTSTAVTWGQGQTNGQTHLPSMCLKGSLFSDTSSSGNLYVCTSANTWNPI